jgi:hypothetical protein
MSFPRYPAYKNSGVEWLGEVPEHWEELKRINEHCMNIYKEQLLEESAIIRKFRMIRSEGDRKVLPHVTDAWIDHTKTKVGYEIPFNRHFYVFTPPRPLEEIDAELKQVTDRILDMIGGLSG